MKRLAPLALALLYLATPAVAELLTYDDEAQFLAELAAFGYCAVTEGFESEGAWGGVRTTIVGGSRTAPSVTHLGVTWLPNNANSEVTTSGGAARTGGWGFFELPHGDFGKGIGDGFVMTAERFYAAGGWIASNTPPAEVNFILDGVTVVDFDDPLIGPQHRFLGLIETLGFAHLEVREIEGKIGDEKLVFADDFTFGFLPCDSDLIFHDGFESGDTNVWSDWVP